MLKFEWAVIGAGPAGIATVGQLVERGINKEQILWIDPYFTVGDFGRHWSNVDSNTNAAFFRDYLTHLDSFEYNNRQQQYTFDNLDSKQTCKLGTLIEPLSLITKTLQNKVNVYTGTVVKTHLYNRLWHLTMQDDTVLAAKNVVFATGAIPKTMSSPDYIDNINMYDALNPDTLAKRCGNEDTVAVFGASHSAVILIRDLLNLNVKKVINFYRQPLKFAVNLGDWILFDDTGLKGNAAIWAQEHLNGKLPNKLERVYASDTNVMEHLPFCTKVIHAIGFTKRSPLIEGFPEWSHNSYNGIIAPGLFGVGIGFPETKTDPYGNTESRVGLRKFMVYLDDVIPLWFKYSV